MSKNVDWTRVQAVGVRIKQVASLSVFPTTKVRHPMAHRWAMVVFAFSMAVSVFPADVRPRAFGSSSAQPRSFSDPPLRIRAASMTPVAELPALSTEDLAELHRKNLASEYLTVGVVREMPTTLAVAPDRTAATTSFSWVGSVRVPTADRLRLRLTDLAIPRLATLWVYGADGSAVGFDSSLAYNGTLWTPSVQGEQIWLEVSSPSEVRFNVSGIGDIRALAQFAPSGTECLRDLACENNQILRENATGVALYGFVKDGNIGTCSGGLILDRKVTFEPYFLTANHCVSTSGQAATVEAFWDYRSSTCGAPPPPLSSLPHTTGASLLVTSSTSDVTLLRLSSLPGTRWFLGWDPNPVPNGTKLYRISHPDAGKQQYSVTNLV